MFDVTISLPQAQALCKHLNCNLPTTDNPVLLPSGAKLHRHKHVAMIMENDSLPMYWIAGYAGDGSDVIDTLQVLSLITR